MKAVILAGGIGSRLTEETANRPKPMVHIGGKPILWHIMKIYSHNGINDFIICLGYKGYMIKEYFANYFLHMSDVTIDISSNKIEVHQNAAEPWRVTLVDTGEASMTGGRLLRVKDYIGNNDFCFTYGDGVGDVDIRNLIGIHKRHGKLVTITATQPPGRFGSMTIENNAVVKFEEKPHGDGAWINGGFFVLSPNVMGYIDGDETVWEREPMQRLTADGEVISYKHHGFWHPMDTLRDKKYLEQLWSQGKAPWKVW
jgi:glucose-1-phosphate cytidylyltransferase